MSRRICVDPYNALIKLRSDSAGTKCNAAAEKNKD